MRVQAQGDNFWIACERWQSHTVKGQIDHVITDAPFTDHVSKSQRRSRGKNSGAADLRTIIDSTPLSFGGVDAKEVCAALQFARRWALTFCAIEQVGDYEREAEALDMRWIRGGIWVKPDATPQFSGDRPAMWGESIAIIHSKRERPRWNRGGHHARWTCSRAGSGRNQHRGGKRYHETQKPLRLMMQLIEAFTDPGDLVWDPYMGSGTTGVACLALGRSFMGHEIDPQYFEAARERLEAAEAGQFGELVDDLAGHRAGQKDLFA